MLQSYLSPAKWTDQLTSSDTPFVRRLGSLNELQQRRHFRFDEFDCVCVGRMPYEQDDDGFLSEFQDTDNGSGRIDYSIDRMVLPNCPGSESIYQANANVTQQFTSLLCGGGSAFARGVETLDYNCGDDWGQCSK